MAHKEETYFEELIFSAAAIEELTNSRMKSLVENGGLEGLISEAIDNADEKETIYEKIAFLVGYAYEAGFKDAFFIVSEAAAGIEA